MTKALLTFICKWCGRKYPAECEVKGTGVCRSCWEK